MGERRVLVSLLVVLLLGAVGWEVGEAGGGGDLMMMGQVAAGWSECGGESMGGGCFSEEEEEFALDSESNRMLQQRGGLYLGNLMLKRDVGPCPIRGRPYTRCGSPPRSPYAKYDRCTGTCLRPPNSDY